MPEVNKVLSIDGGGIRGIIPAIVLAEMERRTGRRISEMFHMIAGTSAGGILALGLALPGPDGKEPRYTAEELIELFQKEGKRIFALPFPRVVPLIRNAFQAKYPSKGIEDVLKEYFGDSRLKDALKDVLVTSYDIERRVPFFFKSRNAKQIPSYDFPMWQVARATSAAPTYFEPLRVEATDLSEYYALVDGGVFANNPAMCAYSDARAVQRERNHENGVDEFLVVSIGSGELTRPLYYEQTKGLFRGWGLWRWVRPILSVVFDGVDKTVHYQMRHSLPPREGARRYYRFQRMLREGNDDLDDVSDRNLRDLRLTARAVIDDNSEELDKLCEQLAEH